LRKSSVAVIRMRSRGLADTMALACSLGGGREKVLSCRLAVIYEG
jgi:hypothetical protein